MEMCAGWLIFDGQIVGRNEENAPQTNGGSLRSRSTASKQPMFEFGPRMQFSCVKLGKTWLKQPPFAPQTFSFPAKILSTSILSKVYQELLGG